MSDKYGRMTTQAEVVRILSNVPIGTNPLDPEQVIERAQKVSNYMIKLGLNPLEMVTIYHVLDHACFAVGFMYTYTDNHEHPDASRVEIPLTKTDFIQGYSQPENEQGAKFYHDATINIVDWLLQTGWTGVEMSSALELWMVALSEKAKSFLQEFKPKDMVEPDIDGLMGAFGGTY